ncbi:MAG TPA: hypothetical protein VJI67_03500 [archaeon]|nr:hypothetical protein [archaeon]HLD80801.1 hypothetical protein [archaeon]
MTGLGSAARRVNWLAVFWAGLTIAIVFLSGAFLGGTLFFTPFEPKTVHVDAVGVTSDDRLELVDIAVSVSPGTGNLYANLVERQNLSREFQQSLVSAFQAAKSLAPSRLNNVDVSIRVSSLYEELGGNSGGAIVALGILSAAAGSKVRQGYYVTGSVDSSGFIHRVAYVPQKARFLQEYGAKSLIVSADESIEGVESLTTRARTLKDAACLVLEGPVLEGLNCTQGA